LIAPSIRSRTCLPYFRSVFIRAGSSGLIDLVPLANGRGDEMKTSIRIFLFSLGAALIGFWPAGAGRKQSRSRGAGLARPEAFLGLRPEARGGPRRNGQANPQMPAGDRTGAGCGVAGRRGAIRRRRRAWLHSRSLPGSPPTGRSQASIATPTEFPSA
jgi:hypothetical protein